MSRRSGLLALTAGLLIALVVEGLYLWPPALLDRIDLSLYDLFLRALHDGATSDRTVIVDIDEQSLSEFGRWPWPRSRLARLLEQIREQGAAGVALSLLLLERDEPAGDQALAEILRDPLFVVGYAFTFTAEGGDRRACGLRPVHLVARDQAGSAGGADRLFRATGVACSVTTIGDAAGGSGFVNAAPDADGVFRRVPQLMAYEGRVYPSLALAILMRLHPGQPIMLERTALGAQSLRIAQLSAPLDGQGNLLVHFRGRQRAFPYLSAGLVLNGGVPRGSLRDKIVFLDTSALGIRTALATPVDPLLPAVEVHATVVDNVLRGDALARPGWANVLEMTLVLALGVGTALLLSMRSNGSALLVVLTGLLTWLAAAWLFHSAGVAVSPLFPTIALGGSLVVVTLLNVLIERRHAAESLRAADELSAQVDERRRREEAAREANRAKSEFLSRMSHELRTPLNAILGFGQLLRMDAAASPEQREGAEHIVRAGRHLLGLIDEVLDISRIEAGRIQLSPEPVALGEAVRRCLELVGPLARARMVQLRVTELDDRLYALADRKRLDQVLLNLLSNAIKYNFDNGTVSVRVERLPARLRVSITDTGHGIAADKLPRLFTPFERLGAERTGVEGTGLGLALSKQLVDAMGGSMHVSSELGRGSTFSIELTPAESLDPDVDETAAHDGARAPKSSAPLTLLYVEDDASNVRLMESILARRPSIRLLVAGNGRTGIELARQRRPDLVLLDRHLPDLTGDAVLRQLLDDPRTKQATVVFLSANAGPGAAEPLLAAGARAYLTKPVDVAQLLALVDDVAARRET